ncbi:MAG: hypothetical protein KC516_00350 [Nanoarchaeota archaeon]|nr:hypothetical protein [Nanoarchaeota archaeon]
MTEDYKTELLGSKDYSFPKSYSKKQKELFIAIDKIVREKRIKNRLSLEDDVSLPFHKNLVKD